MFKIIYPLVIMIIVLVVMKQFISVSNINNRFNSAIIIMIYGLVGALIYFSLTIKNGVFKEIFGDKLFKKLRRKK